MASAVPTSWSPTDVTTEPYPGFPTDMQAQFMALMAVADGASTINETIFENRFMHVPELQRMGADITLQGNSAMVRGVEQLTRRAGDGDRPAGKRRPWSWPGLAAEGETEVRRIYHLDRGYERIEEKLAPWVRTSSARRIPTNERHGGFRDGAAPLRLAAAASRRRTPSKSTRAPGRDGPHRRHDVSAGSGAFSWSRTGIAGRPRPRERAGECGRREFPT